MIRSASVIPIPPGYTIAEYLENFEIDRKDFEKQMNMPEQEVNDLLKGECVLSEDIAKRLESVTEISAETWLRGERLYREKLQIAIDENNGRYSPYNAFDIACWFIAKNGQNYSGEMDFDGITNMKVQKLLYFAQGVGCSLFKRKIFKEDLLAWKHGPVVGKVYHGFARFESDSIDLNSVKSFDPERIADIDYNTELSDVLNIVLDEFNKYTASQLRRMSHEEGSPWAKAYIPNKYNSVIPLDDDFMRYFRDRYGYLKK